MMGLPISRNAQNGVVLLEILIAILIFSFGVLGIVGLQATMLSAASDAKYRSEAGFFVTRLLGEMATANRSSLGDLSTFATGGDRYTAWLNEIQNTNASAGLLGLPGAADNPPTVTITPTSNASGQPVRYDVTVSVFWQAPGQPRHQHVVSASITAD